MASRTLPSIPPEIWLHVFEYATYIPGALETSDPGILSAFFRDTHGIAVNRRFDEANRLKLSLSLVCKKWYCLTTRLLYEYLSVKSGRQALAIANILENRKLWNQHGDRGPGHYTIRLEIALEGVHHWGSKHNQAIACILANCSNLIVLSTAFSSFSSSTFPYMAFVAALTSKKIPIRRLELAGGSHMTQAIISSFSASLEALWLFASLRTWLKPLPVEMNAPKLQILHLPSGDPDGITKLWTMPQLTSFFGKRQGPDNTQGHETLKTYGHLLQFIRIPPNMPLGLALSMCPSLHAVWIDFSLFAHQPLTDLGIQNNIEAICIECLQSEFGFRSYGSASLHSVADCERFLANLNTLTSRSVFPRLQQIRLFLPLLYEPDANAPQHLLRAWDSWLLSCKTNSIAAQVSRGEVDQTAGNWVEAKEGDLYFKSRHYWSDDG